MSQAQGQCHELQPPQPSPNPLQESPAQLKTMTSPKHGKAPSIPSHIIITLPTPALYPLLES
ncbi:hypothetical protein E4U54_000186 [Claviceps lovelessii]|nr:hypothetical protein E4U54_000186 [Claviceps lovelessii]